MSLRIDDGFARHPKVIGLTDAAFRLHVEALCYSAEYLTDGHIPPALVAGRARTARQLVDAGLWHPHPDTRGAYLLHDWHEWNPSGANEHARREAARKRKARQRSQQDTP